jgi:hypothetical protein
MRDIQARVYRTAFGSSSAGPECGPSWNEGARNPACISGSAARVQAPIEKIECADFLQSGLRSRLKQVKIATMQIALLGMKLLEIMFFVGLAGSTVVVLISFIEDGKELFGDDE